MRPSKLLPLLFLFFSTTFAGEPYSFRLMSSFQVEGRTFVGYGMSVPVKVKGKKLLLTALHVVMGNNKEADEILVDYPEGLIRCKVVKYDLGYDLCLLKPRIQPSFTIEVAKSGPKPGDEVLNPNFYKTNSMAIEKGTVDENKEKLWAGTINNFQHGSSGSPMISKDGKVVGIGIAGRTEDGGKTMLQAVCVGPEKVREFFDRSDEK